MSSAFLYPGGVLSLPREAALRLLRADQGDAALYYLWLLAGEEATISWEAGRARAAREALLAAGLIDAAQAAPPATSPPPLAPEFETPPNYGSEDVSQALEGADFPLLVTEFERRLGRRLSPADLQTLLMLHDHLALPPELLLLLLSHCVETIRKKYGEGRRPTLSQIKREAFRWQREGVDTLDAAESYLQRLSRRSEAAARILPLLDIHGREPVEAERRYLDAWAEWGFDDAALRLAYEKTVLKKQSLSWAYMNSILRSWKEKGLLLHSDILARESAPWKTSHSPQNGAAVAASAEEKGARAARDLDRLERLLGSMKEES